MVMVALISAFITMRLAIHGREVDVPAFAGLTLSDAERLASRAGLNLTLENRFYSADIAAGRVLAQAPGPGTRVRRDWTVRVTESLGAQRVSIPDLEGESERSASISIRRASLEPGLVAHMALGGEPGVVIAQTPEANAGDVTGPRISLLVSDGAAEPAETYVMPSLVGLSGAEAAARMGEMGVRIVTADLAQAEPGGVVTSQSPAPGHRIVRGDGVHLAFGHSEGLFAAPAAP